MTKNFKADAHELVEGLSEAADWDELIYSAIVRKAIEAGIADSEAGRVKTTDQIRREFGLDD